MSTRGCPAGSVAGGSWWPTFAGGAATRRRPATHGRTTSGTCARSSSRACEPPVLVAFSRGSSYALGYALQFPDQVRGLVVGDYLARHVGLPAEFAEQQLRMDIRGIPVAERMPEHAVRGVYAESRDVPLWDRLAELRCPVLVIRGGRRGSLLTDELAGRWQASLPSAQMATIAGAGHDLWSRDPDAYLAVLLPFLERIGPG